MLRKNNFVFGFVLALAVTAAVYGIMYLINITLLKAIFHKLILSGGTMMTTGLSANMITVNYYTRRNANQTAKGVMVFFLVCAIYIVYNYFGVSLGIKSE